MSGFSSQSSSLSSEHDQGLREAIGTTEIHQMPEANPSFAFEIIAPRSEDGIQEIIGLVPRDTARAKGNRPASRRPGCPLYRPRRLPGSRPNCAGSGFLDVVKTLSAQGH